MKVKELIQELSTFYQDAEITLTTSEDICIFYICEDGQGNRLTKETSPYVFIEPKDNCPICTSEYMNGDTMWCSFYDCPCREVEECNQFEELDER